jgi:hypothetical protein
MFANILFVKYISLELKGATSLYDTESDTYFHRLYTVMGTHSFIRDVVTVTVTSLVKAVTNEFIFSAAACNEVTEAIGDLKTD